jgi:hypothetical protein
VAADAIRQRLWGHRLGQTTSLRLTRLDGAKAAADPAAAFSRDLVAHLDPGSRGSRPQTSAPARSRPRAAPTDFGQYFVYFSFFLVVAALLLAGLFFRYGLEQRLGELGVLRAVGFTEARLRRVFLAEAALLATAGALLGMAGAVGYAWLMMLGLRTVWLGAVGTRSLALAVGPAELATGAGAGIAARARVRRAHAARAARAIGAQPARARSAGVARGPRPQALASGRSCWSGLPPSCSAPVSPGA